MSRGAASYARFRASPALTLVGNILESCYILLRAGERDLAALILEDLGPHTEELPLAMVAAVASLRLSRKGATGKRLSYVDAAGYVYAIERGLRFLTGAEEFEGMEGVEFVR